jgi:molybdopterin synthase sulfur carrier subunit
VKLLYFAWVRQKIGRGNEDMELPAGVSTIAELMAKLGERGGGYADVFAEPLRLLAARNQEHVQFDARVVDDDEIAFFPPVTGG